MVRVVWIIALLSIFPAFAAVRLPVKYHEQERALSCEAAALTMVLQFHGLEISEADVIKKMPFDKTPRQAGIWGDPDEGFVGNIDGEMAKTGYGIHWNALARTASAWKKSTVIENGTIEELQIHLDQKRPIVIWGVKGPGEEISWNTPKGRKVFARSNEHARVVFGYGGTRKKPKSIWVMDPRMGPLNWTIEEFLKDWDSFGRKGVVVYE